MNESGGQVIWKLDADLSGLEKGLLTANRQVDSFGKELDKVGKRSFGQFSADAGDAFTNIANGFQRVVQASAALAVGGAFGFGAMAKASFDMMRQVENATFALKAFTGSAEQAGNITSELVAYAQSDTGVLFQRGDLLDAAAGLATFGAEATKVTSYVKTMSKGVALGYTNFQELSQILGRVGAQGRLTGVDFDVLTARGIRLDENMRNASVTFDQLFQAVDRAIPAGVLEGRADSIDGRIIRLQSSFRNLGNELLGVTTIQDQYGNSVTKFAEGGLGDRFLKLMERLRGVLSSPEVKRAFSELGRSVAGFAENILPKIIDGFVWLVNNRQTVVAVLGAIAAGFVAAKAAAIGFSIAASANPLGLIAAAIVAVTAGIAFLQIRFEFFTKALDAFKGAIDAAANATVAGFTWIRDRISEGIDAIVGFFTRLKDGAKAGIDGVVGFFRDLPSKALEALGNFAGQMYDAGRNAIEGFVNGLKDFIGKVGQGIQDIGNSAVNGLKGLLGIKSPSRVFYGIGKNTVLGLVGGITDNARMATNAMNSLTAVGSSDISIGSVSPDMVSGSLGRQGEGSRSVVINENNTFQTPVDLERYQRNQAWRLANI